MPERRASAHFITIDVRKANVQQHANSDLLKAHIDRLQFALPEIAPLDVADAVLGIDAALARKSTPR